MIGMDSSLYTQTEVEQKTPVLWFVWFFITLTIISFFAYLFIGGSRLLPANTKMTPLTITRVYEDGTIRLSGVLMVPTPCDQIDVKTKHSSSDTITVNLSIKESAVCEQESTPRTFTAVVAGDSNTNISFTKDGNVLPITFIEK